MDPDMSFQGARILVVEDDMMIAMLVEDMLLDFGCHVVGPASNLTKALALAREAGPFSAAILDVNLGLESVFPAADLLRAQGVPLIFCTGYGDGALREADKACTVLRKPYRASELGAALSVALTPA